MLYPDIACSVDSTTVPTVRAMSADEMVQSGFDCVDWIGVTDEDPDLDHVACFGVLGTGVETRCDDDTIRVLVEDVTVR